MSEQGEHRLLIAELLAEQLEAEAEPGWEAVWRWCLSRPTIEAWLGPFVRRVVEEAPGRLAMGAPSG